MRKIQINCSRNVFHVLEGIIVLAIILTSSQITSSTGQAEAVVGSPTNLTYNSYPDYALSSLSTNSIVSLGFLASLTGGSSSIAAFEHVIQQTFLSINVRQVLLDISWQNYSIGTIPYEQWVSNWLSACDVLGVNNVFYVAQLTGSGIGSPWIESLIKADPSVQTYDQNGHPVSYVSIDNPDVATAIEKDLAILDSYYGAHQSWMGIGTGYPQNDPYYSSNSTMSVMGYSNSTLNSFANSLYFESDVNGSGYLPNGQQDSLWTEFRNVPQSTVLSSGNWMTSTAYPVYGIGNSQHQLLMRFHVQNAEPSLLIQWYGNKVGSPGILTLNVVRDANGAPGTNQVIANATESPNLVSVAAGWQSALSVNGNFSSGSYWVVISSPGGDSNNYYNIYMRDYEIQGASAIYMLPNGSGQIQGSTVLWVKTQSGNDVGVYPYEGSYIPNTPQQFIAGSSFTFNTVYLFLSDRIYNPTNATLNVFDSTRNTLVASGTLSQQANRGQQNWIPINLDRIVSTIPGDRYVMSLTEPNSGYSWETVLRGVTVNPAEAGFQNQSQSWLFRLGFVDFTQGFTDFTAMTTTGVDSVQLGHPDAIQFTVPNSTSGTRVLTNVSLLMKGGSGYYSNDVALTVSVCANDPKNIQPVGSPLKSISVAGQLVPRSGWLEVTGFNLSLTAGGIYWMVFGTNSTGVTFSLARLVSPYNLDFLISQNGGKTWSPPAEGPTELSFMANFSGGESVGNLIDNIPTISVTPSRMFAEPFVAQNDTQATGVFLGPLGGSTSPSNFEIVSINPDDGRGSPSSDQLASGTIYSANITLNYGLQLIQFSSAAHLEAGRRYWIVVHPVIGSFSLDPVEYSGTPVSIPTNFTAMMSGDGGYSWKKFSNDTTIMSYMIASSPNPLPSYSTTKLFNDIATYHNFTTTSGELRGWNAYIQSSELQIFSEVAGWFQATTGKSFNFYAKAESNVIDQVGYSNIKYLPDTTSSPTCSALSQELLANLNLQVQQFNEIARASLLQQCPTLQAMEQEMNYMRYVGSGYESNLGARVLVVGDQSQSDLTGYFSNAFVTNYVSLVNGSALIGYGNLSKFDAVVWLSTNASSAYESTITNYVDNGGTLIVARQPPPWMSNLIGIDWNSMNTTETEGQPINGSLSELSKLVYHTQYYGSLQAYRISNNTIVGRDNGLSLGVNQLGMGKVEFIYMQNDSAGFAQMSDTLVVLSNMISNSLGQSQNSPFWLDNASSFGGNVSYSIIGNGKSPVLVWFFNPSSMSAQVSLHINGTYYGIGSRWILINPSAFQTIRGNGTDIPISTTVPSDGWTAFYAISQAANLNIAYTSADVARQLSYNGQGLYSLSGSVNQSSIAIISSKSSASSVLLDDQANLTRVVSIGDLLNTSQGWLYDAQNHLMLIKFVSNGNDSIRVILTSLSPTQSYTTPFVMPMVFSLVVLVSAEVALFSILRFRRRK